MTLLQKTPAKLSSGNIKEEEEQEDLEQLLAEKINAILTECLELIEEVGTGKGLLDRALLLLEHPRGGGPRPPSSRAGLGASRGGSGWIWEVQTGYWEKCLYWKSGQALAQAAQGSGGVPIPGGVQNPCGCGTWGPGLAATVGLG